MKRTTKSNDLTIITMITKHIYSRSSMSRLSVRFESETPLAEKPSPVLTPIAAQDVQEVDQPEDGERRSSDPSREPPPPLVSVQEATPLHEPKESEETRDRREVA